MRPVIAPRMQPTQGTATSSSALPSSLRAAQKSRADRQLRELLQLRLKRWFSIGFCLVTCLCLFSYPSFSGFRWYGQLVLVALLLLPALWLWRAKEIPLRSLRLLELHLLAVMFAGGFFICAVRSTAVSTLSHLPPELASVFGSTARVLFPDGSYYFRYPVAAVCNPIVITWGILAVAYSVLIPNTWTRCAIILSLMVAGALSCTAYACYCFPAILPFAGWSLFYTFFVVTSFAAIGLYGSHKLSTLQSEVLTAQQVGQYYLKQTLGKGGMGEVFLAQHRMLRRPCAVKLIRPEHAGDASSLARFEREVQAMAKLTHPNTVEIYDYGRTDDGTFYYAMEYLPGLSAEDLIRRCARVPPGRAVHLLRQVCAALDEAHAAGLIHRDIKPANIFICERGRIHDVVKLLDFGLVQLAGASEPPAPVPAPALETEASAPAAVTSSADVKLTQAGHILGTPAYMSPEQARGDLAEPRSDIYSVGAVAYYLLTGQPPFRRPTVSQMMAAHERERPRPLAELLPAEDAALSAVIMRCLEKEPSQRYQSVKELEQALSACPSAGTWDAESAARWWQQELPKLTLTAPADAPPADDSAGSLLVTRDATAELTQDAETA